MCKPRYEAINLSYEIIRICNGTASDDYLNTVMISGDREIYMVISRNLDSQEKFKDTCMIE